MSELEPPRKTGHRSRVLVIDDSEISLDVTRAVLTAGGFEVRATRSLGELNVILKTWSPDIVLTDVNMPGVSGPDICRWIRARSDTKGVHVVLLSGAPKEELRALAREAGAHAYISKETENLAGAIQALCEMVRR